MRRVLVPAFFGALLAVAAMYLVLPVLTRVTGWRPMVGSGSFRKWDGVWEGTQTVHKSSGEPDESHKVRHEYRSDSDTFQTGTVRCVGANGEIVSTVEVTREEREKELTKTISVENRQPLVLVGKTTDRGFLWSPRNEQQKDTHMETEYIYGDMANIHSVSVGEDGALVLTVEHLERRRSDSTRASDGR